MIALALFLACTPAPEPAVAPTAGVPNAVAPTAVSGTADANPGTAVSGAIATKGGRYTLTWSPEPAPVPFNTLFAVRTQLFHNGTPVSDGTVRVNASMPQHGHGMMTRPIDDPGVCAPTAPAKPTTPPDPPADPPVCTHPDGYRTDGLKFHMQGEWLLHFEVNGPAGPDRLDVPYSL